MSWVDVLITFRHNMFIVFIECKFDEMGTWVKKYDSFTGIDYQVVTTHETQNITL